MAVITFSRVFPAYHPKKGQNTDFVEKLSKGFPPYSADEFTPLKSDPTKDIFSLLVLNIEDWADLKPKYHTIRAGHRWKVGDKFSPRVWSGKPYYSKQITIAPDIEIRKVWDFKIQSNRFLILKDNKWRVLQFSKVEEIAQNDGLSIEDFHAWFKYPKPFEGQIICWNESINY